MTVDLQTAQSHWAAALEQLQGQMTRATFEFCLHHSQVVAILESGAYQVGVVNPNAVEWLANRLQINVQRALAPLAGRQVDLEFIPLAGGVIPPAAAAIVEPVEAGPSEAGLALASINYYSAYFETRGSGFSQVPHAYTYFWQFLLGPGFDLWLLLAADEKTGLTKNPATWWSQPRSYSFEKLTQRLNRKHPRYVTGGELECTRSRDWRREGRAIQHPEGCCLAPRYAHLRFKKHTRSGLICSHWSEGLLEILVRWQLAVVELNEGYKCQIQLWRLLPYLTPFQVSLLHPTIQAEYETWLREYGARLDPPINYPFWQTTAEENIVPLLPTHDQPELNHNFADRRQYQDFVRHSVPNPGYRPNGEEEGDGE